MNSNVNKIGCDVTSLEAFCIMFYFLLGNISIFGSGPNVKRDIWISIIMSSIFAIVLFLVLAYLLDNFRGKSIFDILLSKVPKPFNSMLCMLYILFGIHVASISVNVFSSFVKTHILTETPRMFLAISIALFCIYMSYIGISAIGKWCIFFLPLILFTLILPNILSTNLFSAHHLTPIISSSYTNLFINSIFIFALPFCESIILFCVFTHVNNEVKSFKILRNGLIITSVVLVTMYIRNILILGSKCIEMINYPSFYTFSILKIGDFFQRFEVLISSNFLLMDFVKISICIIFSSIGIAALLGIDNYKIFIIPVALLILGLSLVPLSTTIDLFSYLKIYPYISITFGFVIPTILCLTDMFYKKQKEKEKGKKKFKIT